MGELSSINEGMDVDKICYFNELLNSNGETFQPKRPKGCREPENVINLQAELKHSRRTKEMHSGFTVSEGTSFPEYFMKRRIGNVSRRQMWTQKRERGSLQEVGGERRLHLSYTHHSTDGARLCALLNKIPRGQTRFNHPAEDSLKPACGFNLE